MPKLQTFKEAAEEWGVPAEALRRKADDLGYTIEIGRAARLNPDEIPELIRKCRVNPRPRACTGETAKTEPAAGKSGTEPRESRPAQQAALKLKQLSPRTSKTSSGQVAHLPQKGSK